LRSDAGLPSYGGGFVEHYLMRIIYPDGLTRATQYVLAGAVIVVNGAIYGWLLHRRRRHAADNLAA
jgi:S-adenosylhomocysteine hydrolase